MKKGIAKGTSVAEFQDEGCEWSLRVEKALLDGVKLNCVNCPFSRCIEEGRTPGLNYDNGEKMAYTQGTIDAINKNGAIWVSEGFNAGLKLRETLIKLGG